MEESPGPTIIHRSINQKQNLPKQLIQIGNLIFMVTAPLNLSTNFPITSVSANC